MALSPRRLGLTWRRPSSVPLPEVRVTPHTGLLRLAGSAGRRGGVMTPCWRNDDALLRPGRRDTRYYTSIYARCTPGVTPLLITPGTRPESGPLSSPLEDNEGQAGPASAVGGSPLSASWAGIGCSDQVAHREHLVENTRWDNWTCLSTPFRISGKFLFY